MADRTVAVTLKAQVLDFVAGMGKAAAATAGAKKAMVETATAAQNQQKAMVSVGLALAGVGAAAAAGLALAVKASAEYGAKMAQLQSLSHASADDMKRLSDAAMTVGTAYGFSATQVADAEIELTKAGVSVKDQLGGALTGALTLAAAGQLNVADATSIATVAMTDFNLKASDVPHVADLLAAGADKALGSVQDLGEGIKNGGQQAANMGLTITDTVGVLSQFANAGLIGAEAGTQLRSMFIQIQKPTAKARDVMEQYGITMYDTNGKFVGMSTLAGELHDKLGGLTQAQRNAALATIFGSYAINGASILMRDGAKATAEWTKKVNDYGFASAQASGKMNSLQGDVQKLSAAFQTDLIKAGSSADGALRGVVKSLTAVVNAFGALPQPVQGGVIAVTAAVAGIGLLGGAVLTVIPKIAEFKLALKELNLTGGQFAGKFAKGGVVLAAVTDLALAFTALGDRGQATSQQLALSANSIEHHWKNVDKLIGSTGFIGKGLKDALATEGDGSFFTSSGSAKVLDAFTLGLTHFSDVYKANEGQIAALGEQLAGLSKLNYGQAANSFNELTRREHLNAEQTKQLLQLMPAYREELIAQLGKIHVAATETNILAAAQRRGAVGAKLLAAQHREAAAAAQKNATAQAVLAGKVDASAASVKDLQKALTNLDGGLLDERSASRAFQQAIDDATAAVKKNGRNLDINTQKGRDNQAALDGIAEAAQTSAKATLDAGGSAKEAAGIMARGRSAFINAAEAMGLGSKEAKKLADKLFAIPKNTTPHIRLTGVPTSLDELAKLDRAINNLHGKTIDVRTNYTSTGAKPTTAGRFAAGGAIDGPGTKGVDSRLILAAPGEHVLTAAEVDALGGQGGVYRLRQQIMAGQVPRYAAGGAVPRYSAGPTAPAAPGQQMFTGDLYLDSGEFLGKVRGEVSDGIRRHEHARKVSGGAR